MQEQTPSPLPRWTSLLAALRRRLFDPACVARHRRKDEDFTRERTFTFPVVMLLLLQKTTRSVQRHLQTFFDRLWTGQTGSATPGAWTQARAKLRHTAFIELNQQVVLPEFYAPAQAAYRRTWKDHRLLGGDGSLLRLPSHPTTVASFGEVPISNSHGDTGISYVPARLSVLYDLLNHMGIDALVRPVSEGEVDLLAEQLTHVEPGDILIWDRGFTGFVLMAQTLARGADFVGRCSTGSFLAAQELFRLNRAGRSRIVKLLAANEHWPKLKALRLPRELTVRFLSLRLPTGELEVLVTSLLDKKAYPTQEFLEVYNWRWNHETYHLMLKGRLDMENWFLATFSG